MFLHKTETEKLYIETKVARPSSSVTTLWDQDQMVSRSVAPSWQQACFMWSRHLTANFTDK